ncbi:MAG: hypothetical protein B7Z72_11210 [Gemmatimonadetes bacterium 21-71-4]|nr:MAG: hypothetical protein B7Z72_11210 [Gemmatimonadetes bacterium 21-71-4]
MIPYLTLGATYALAPVVSDVPIILLVVVVLSHLPEPLLDALRLRGRGRWQLWSGTWGLLRG